MSDDLRMNAYYYAFGRTGVRSVDLILSALAHAGKGYHHTEDWNDSDPGDWGPFRGPSYVDWIQNAANDAAEQHEAMYQALKSIAATSGDPVIEAVANSAIAKAEGRA